MTGREAPGGVYLQPTGPRSPSRSAESRRGRPGAGYANVGGLVTALLGIFLWQGLAWAQEPEQERDCTLVKVGGYTESRRQDSINYTHRASGGVDYRCTDGTRILSDSAVVWEHSGNAFFFGSVHFEDPDTELDADSARYFDNVQELIAYSNVVLTDRKGGAVIRGETLSYLSDSRFRKEDRILVYGGSPRAVVYPARRPAAPVSVAEAVEGSIGEAEGVSGDAEEEDPAADSVADEMEAPPEDSVPDEQVDSTAAGAGEQAEDPPADSVIEGLPTQPPGADPEDLSAELARLDSLAGISAEAGAETDAAPETEAASTDAPVDSVTPLPYEVEAPRIMIDGRRFFRAGGGVVVTRDSLRAFGDSLDYDQEVGAMLILGEASVEDSDFRLKGLSVALTPTAGLNEEILAREEAELTGDEVLMTAPAIRLFLEDSKVSRLVALPTVPPLDDGAEALDTTGLTAGDAERVRAMAEAAAAEAAVEDSLSAPDSLPRPSVIAADFNLTGDSIEVLSPGQVLDVVTAVGAARADAMGQDSLVDEDLPEMARNDWLEGETIIARFASVDSVEDSTAAAQPGPAGRRARLETLTAINDARSFYRLYTADTTEAAADTSDTAPVETTDEPDPPPEEPPAVPEDPTATTDQPDSIPEEDGATSEECDTTGADGERRPELHYVSGNQITIFLEGRKVVKMEVTGRTQGYHFEPVPPDCESAAADSAAVAPDTLTTPPDTTTIPPDTLTAPPGPTRATPVAPHPSTATPRHSLPGHPRRTTSPTRPTRRPGGAS